MSEKVFNKVLAANRGEIAVRIFRACYDLGIHTVAMYSKEDELSLFRTRADEAYLVGENKSPLGAYLDIPEIIDLAKRRGVDAIHPGYGFLSENADFARACEEAGITFIGPPSDVLGKMGDKLSAKQIAMECGVPVIPGCSEPLRDGQEALDLLGVEVFDLVVLDLNLPRIDGMTVLGELRKTDCETKVLILSARGEVSDKVAGLDAGANDYLTKPFHLDELAARIRSLTLRRFAQSDIVLTCGKLRFDTKARIASVDSEALSLTRKETGILEYLMLNQGRPVSQEELIEHVWDSTVNSFSNAIRVHISSLRKKLRIALGYDPIRNRIGEGYVMEDSE